ncbi:MAG: tRNA dihydrouridine synthase DusB [Firmicutes bacterium]|nr:tRNA dihydrouridine synthase DusB [Bacillota bacterium]MBO2521584.1 tRNA dihydrouridine synthase DusB [Bacillota bacterium]
MTATAGTTKARKVTGPVIGPVQLESPVVLAPMAGVCNLAFRLLCKEQGAALVCSEFVSAKALVHGNQKSFEMLAVSEKERPVSIQIFGSTPEDAAFAARAVEEAGADIVDFNMGCPVPKVLKAEAGAALMRVPDKAQAILKAMVDAVSIPVTVKVRTGWDDRSINVVDLAKRFEDVGVAAIAVHGRTTSQGRSGRANWEIIGEVKQAVRIPVIGNGDVFTPQDAEAMLEMTGCDGVMIGRGALGNPWIFKRTRHYLETGELLPEPTASQRVEMARRHLRLLAELKGEYVAVREMRQHAPAYIKGFPGAAAFRARLVRCDSIAAYDDVFAEFLAGVEASGG